MRYRVVMYVETDDDKTPEQVRAAVIRQLRSSRTVKVDTVDAQKIEDRE